MSPAEHEVRDRHPTRTGHPPRACGPAALLVLVAVATLVVALLGAHSDSSELPASVSQQEPGEAAGDFLQPARQSPDAGPGAGSRAPAGSPRGVLRWSGRPRKKGG